MAVADLRRLEREYEALMDIDQFRLLFWERVNHPSSKLKLPRALERNFLVVQTPAGRRIVPMRYHCRPHGKPAWFDSEYDGLYNARRTSLDQFWRGQFGCTHGLIVLNTFLENVSLHKLEGRELAPGEKEQNVIVRYWPQAGSEMCVPCVWSHWQGDNETLLSCALITDEPPPEIAATGHDRCPINLTRDAALSWLSPHGRSDSQLFALLEQRQRPQYDHERLAA